MATATLTSKGQTTIPKSVRDRLRLKPGDLLEFVVQEDGSVLMIPVTVPVADLYGILPLPARPMTLNRDGGGDPHARGALLKGLDSNVLVRYLVRDDPAQAELARRFIQTDCTGESPCLLNRVVLCELVWVLETAYGYPRDLIASVIEKLLQTAAFRVEDADAAWAALRYYRGSKADYADAIIAQVNQTEGCETTLTFDRKAAKLDGFRLLVGAP